jgi:hypothetical protein
MSLTRLLYKLERTDEPDYDQFRGMVVCATSEEQALFTVARSERWRADSTFEENMSNILDVGLPTTVEEYLQYELLGWDEEDLPDPRAHWKATVIGVPVADVEPGIIMKNFLQG